MSNLSSGIFPPARDDRVWGVRTGAVRGRWVSNCCDGIAGRRPSSGQTAGTLRDSSVLSTENQLETADRTETALPLDRDIVGRVRIGRDISTETSDGCRSLLPPRPNLCLINQSPRPHLRFLLMNNSIRSFGRHLKSQNIETLKCDIKKHQKFT